MNKKLKFLTIFVFVIPHLSFAYNWDHSIQLGYGISHDPNHTKYNNQAFLLTADLFPLYRSCYTFWSITGALGHLLTNASVNSNVNTAAVSAALRIYPFDFANDSHPYILGSLGPAYISNRWFGLNEQAGNFTLQTNIGLGVEHNAFDINLRLHHFSNAGLGHPNHGFNVLYLLSIGYLF